MSSDESLVRKDHQVENFSYLGKITLILLKDLFGIVQKTREMEQSGIPLSLLIEQSIISKLDTGALPCKPLPQNFLNEQ